MGKTNTTKEKSVLNSKWTQQHNIESWKWNEKKEIQKNLRGDLALAQWNDICMLKTQTSICWLSQFEPLHRLFRSEPGIWESWVKWQKKTTLESNGHEEWKHKRDMKNDRKRAHSLRSWETMKADTMRVTHIFKVQSEESCTTNNVSAILTRCCVQ